MNQRHLMAATVSWVLVGCGTSAAGDRNTAPSGDASGATRLLSGSEIEGTPMFDSRTVEQIKLRYRDASTPPRHHRSYTIVATREELHVSIDVYGVVVAEERNLVLQADWQTVSRAVTELEWVSETASDGNTGGSAYSLELTAGEERRSCTWSRERTPGSERLTAFAKRLERLVPNLAALIETPYSG